jgi:hypothetical protein
MATKKTSKAAKTKAKSAPKKAATKKAVAKKAPASPAGAKKAAARKSAPKPNLPKKAAITAAPDPMGCCTWTNNAGQIIRRDMRKSQCTFTGAIFVPDVSCT